MKRLFVWLLLAPFFTSISCDETGYEHYYTEYLVTSGDSIIVEYLDKSENWVVDTGERMVYYEFDRSPYQPLELKVRGLKTNQRIIAVIKAERKQIAYKEEFGDSLYFELKAENYPNY
mgnify:CR=1 FL=1|tara:strand:+ start:2407 stop:2760 length:354 start_codon:yes stop_codon:yes gene_type:complete